jgi:hypothetical protein
MQLASVGLSGAFTLQSCGKSTARHRLSAESGAADASLRIKLHPSLIFSGFPKDTCANAVKAKNGSSKNEARYFMIQKFKNFRFKDFKMQMYKDFQKVKFS